ncbi:MAG: archaellin/type IV pilin N-terminal domain-containing protein [Ignisphaera sp.]|uniref:Type IV pilin n=1 Tax=Ignisphaera aggregans TaxID=334771 RepID=A0A7J3MYS7_9CREN
MKYTTRAVSPVVATVILVIITVAAALLLWSWVSGIISPPTSSVTNMDRLRIAGVRLEGTINEAKLVVYVHNMGNTPAEVLQLLIFEVNGNLVDATTNVVACKFNDDICDDTNRVVEPNSIARIEWDMGDVSDKGYDYGYIYFVSIVTASGFETRSSFVWSIQA